MSAIDTFGPTLRSVRGELGLTQEAVAHAIGTTQRHLSFLETGRSAPTREMLGRLVAGLGLSAAQRVALFDSSGFRNPYPARALGAEELQRLLDLMERQVLHHWPFPAFVVDRDWNFLRSNGPGAAMIDAFGGLHNMHTMFLSPAFGEVVTNWEAASASFYTRMQQVAGRSAIVREALDRAVDEGRFDHVPTVLAGVDDVPIYVPVDIRLPDGTGMRFTSMYGSWVSIHDAVAEQFEVELVVPLDADSEASLAAVFG
ncbi:MAG: helix-turn-helix domain-containing protein [Actinomycetota bacterium]